MKCRECEREFVPSRWWQDFCCTDHRQAFHRRKYKQEAVEAAADAREERMNGHGVNGHTEEMNGHANGGVRGEEKIDLVSLGLATPPKPIARRKIA
jgi:hypothetical protein